MRGLMGRMAAAPVVRSAAAAADGGSGGGWMPLFSTKTAVGVAVTQASALKVSTVFACVTIPAEDIARATPRLYRTMPPRALEDGRVLPGGRTEVTDHPVAKRFKRPNRYQDWYQFAGMMERCIGLKSNAYAVVLTDGAGWPVEWVPMNPDKVTILEATDGSVFYRFAPSGNVERSIFDRLFRRTKTLTVPAEYVLHLQDLGLTNMLYGCSRIGFAADAIGLALAQEQQAAHWMRNGAKPAVVLTTEQELSDTAARRIKAEWEELNGGLVKGGGTAVLEQGLKPEKLSLSSTDMEFLASRNFQVEDICRFFRMPPHKVAKLDRATNNNVAAQDSDYLNNSLSPRFTRWERRLDFHFGLDEQGLEVDFDLTDLFRADPGTRMTTARQGVAGSILTKNEARRHFDRNLPPVEGGDELLEPTNMAATGSHASGSAPDGAGRPPEDERLDKSAGEVAHLPFDRVVKGHADQPRDSNGRWTSGGVGVAATIADAVAALAGLGTADAKAAVAAALARPAFAAFAAGSTPGFHAVAVLEDAVRAKLGTTARVAVLSRDSAFKQTREHPDVTAADYSRVQGLFDHGEIRRETPTRLALLREDGKWHVATAKTAANGTEVLLLSFRRANPRTVEQLRKRTTAV